VLGQAKIEHLDEIWHPAALRNEEVGRLEIAMNHTLAMGLCQRAAGLGHEIHRAPCGQRTIGAKQGVERHPFQIFHGVVHATIGGTAEVVQRHGIGMG
jgi:hypothetical protein